MENKLLFHSRSFMKALMVIVFLMLALSINYQFAAAQTYDCSSVTDVLEGDCEALVAFYDATDGPNWADNTNWLATDTACNWYGIQCSDHGSFKSVYGIYLENNQVAGSLPPEMGDYFDLQWIDLDNNQISGPIPPQLPSSNLRGLSISNNQLTGAIPVEFGVSARLYYLELGNNQLSGPIPAELGSLGSLTTFYMLDLSNNNLSGLIPVELGNLTNLEELMLEDNQLSGSLPSTFGDLSNLERMTLQNNQIEGSLPDTWGSIGNLVELKIQENPLLSGPIPTSFTNLSALTSFYFNDTGICVPVFYEVQYWLDHLDDVVGPGLYCSYDPFCDVVDQTPQTECEALVDLFNNSDGENWTNHDDWLTVNRPCLWQGVGCDSDYHITQVNLGNNNLFGSIPPTITDLGFLRVLNLPDNQLTGVMPQFGVDSNDLQILNLSSNNLVGSIPPTINGLSDLQVLDLSDNQLSGDVPTGFGPLIYLQILNLSNNQLTGIMPHFGNPNDLQILDLSHNQLTGISSTVEFLTNVHTFDLSYNQIANLTSAIGNMSSLQFLRLQSNGAYGSIPTEFGDLNSLQELYLNDNSLYGTLPPELENLINLTDFRINSNPDLSGPIPLGYTNLINLGDFRFSTTGICEPDDPTFQAWISAIPYVVSSNIMCPNTFAGSESIVSPIDATTGTTPVTITFQDVPEDGYTSLETSDSGPPPPMGFQLPNQGVYFELGTTVTYTPPIEICIDYSGYGVPEDEEDDLMIWHYEWGLGEWAELTYVTLRDTTNDILCAYSSSLSPFALFEPTFDPLEQIGIVSAQVQSLIDSGRLNKGQGNALLSKLENAHKQLSNGKVNSAIQILEAFINQVEGFIRSGILTPEEADPLIDNVTLILIILGAGHGM